MLTNATPMGFIAVSALSSARAFYEGVLGLSFVSEDAFALVLRSGPIVIRFTVPPERATQGYTVFGWQVDDIEDTVSALAARGIVFERYAFLADMQNAACVWSAPGGDRVAWFRDPDGNVLSVSQHKAGRGASRKDMGTTIVA